MNAQQSVEWRNAGQLPPDGSLARLMAKHPSQPANPDIARALFLAGKIESWGRGIELIRNACLAAAGPAPRFDCDSTGFWVEFSFPVMAISPRLIMAKPPSGHPFAGPHVSTGLP